ncbi:MAG TPA: cellulase family glycosylhydrolase [Chitinivibrionales bacterium]|nr:cellulase family glycosylhydrolase [Chitinivibrionales bacterium]
MRNLCSRKSLMLMGALALMMVMGSFMDSSALGRRQLHLGTGGRMLDENGNTVTLMGFGLGGWLMFEGYMWKISGGSTSTNFDCPHKMEPSIIDLMGGDTASANQFWNLYRANYVSEKDFCSMKAWGCNSVRVSFNSTNVMPLDGQPASPPYVYNDSGWQLFDNIVNWCTKYQLWLIWDMHGAPGGQSGDNIADADGTARLWTQPTIYQPRAIDLWMKIVQRYANNDWVVGYNLLNEPLLNKYGIDRMNLRNFYIQVTDSIRKIDTKGLLFIDGDNYAQNFTDLTPPWDPLIVYSFHCYPPCCSYFGIDGFATQYNTGMWHGETGENGQNGATAAYNSYDSCVTHLENHNPPVGWAWWTIKKFSNFTEPYSIVPTAGFQACITYWNGGAKPTVAVAKAALLDMAAKTNSDSTTVTFIPEMLTSLKLNPNNKCTVPVAYMESVQPMGFSITQNAATHTGVVISFTLPYSYPVTLNIYDMNGKLQKSLINRSMSAGKQSVTWDRTNMAGKKVVNGVYLYKFTMGEKTLSHHFVLAK